MRRTLALVMVLVSGCAAIAPPGDGTEGGPGVPAQRPDRPIAGERQAVSGRVQVQENGCLRVALDDGRTMFVIWPAGAAMDASGAALVVGDRRLQDADPFRAVGAVVPVRELPDAAYWREAHLLFCDPEAAEVLVLDTVD